MVLIRLVPNIGVKPDAVASRELKPAAKPKKNQPKEPVFDFYTLLPESETVNPVNKSTVRQIQTKPEKTTSKSTSSKKPAPSYAAEKANKKGPPVTTAATSSNENFLLQAGSFRSSQDADRLRVQLILSGYDARIVKSEIRNGEVWHRVQLGPYRSRTEVDQIKTKLASQGLETMLLRQR